MHFVVAKKWLKINFREKFRLKDPHYFCLFWGVDYLLHSPLHCELILKSDTNNRAKILRATTIVIAKLEEQ